jgi:hypothetical protein
MKNYNDDQNENEYTIRFEGYTDADGKIFRIALEICGIDIADKFPKFVKAFAQKSYSPEFGTEISTRVSVSLSADDVNKGKNETGMKRLRRFIEIVRTLKPVEFKLSDYNKCSNSIAELPAELTK